MRMKLWHAAFLGTGLLAVAAALYAAPLHGDHGPGHMAPAGCPHGGQGHGPCGGGIAMMHQALFELNLSDAQHEAVHETLKTRRADIATALKPVIEAKRALHDAVLADNPDDAAIRNAAAALGTSIGDAAVTFADIRVEVFDNAQLTPEQMQKFAEFRAEVNASVDTFLNEHIPGFQDEHAHE